MIDGALTFVQGERANMGAIKNRLDYTISNLTNIVANTESSRSQIMDADFAKESSVLSKNKMLQQSSLSMLAQANSTASEILQLLR